MKIALLGYGKMGKMIESIAIERGHEIVLKISIDNPEDFNEENIKKADVAIEFSTPESAFENIEKAITWGVPVVAGTTGWLDKIELIREKTSKTNGAFIYASNFSLGVNIFFEVNRKLAELIGPYDYKCELEEIHHTAKLDAPSGTAITLAEGVLQYDTKYNNKWVNEQVASSDALIIKSLRIGTTPGTHTVSYHSEIDSIEIKHTAHTRSGFALGAVVAAEFLQGKTGEFSMKDVLGIA